ncbi:hypothetical protein [Carboxylicivirga sp. RSCT41]|uniref:hypothetical protein n=1 Tax=Carboxylicivirga agarovorans TaxID=3417570 RepID=UPI003D34F154
MKTSKLILIVFLSVFCLSLLSFLITVDGKKYKGHSEQLETITEDLPDFRVVKVLDGAKVSIETGNNRNLKYAYHKDSIDISVYEISADTLILKPLKLDHYVSEYTVESFNITEIINNGGTLSIDLMQDSLNISNQDEGHVFINQKSSINNIQLKSGTRANSVISATNIQHLIMDVDNSKVTVNKDIKSVDLIANNSSKVILQSVNSLAVKCDSTSRFNVY